MRACVFVNMCKKCFGDNQNLILQETLENFYDISNYLPLRINSGYTVKILTYMIFTCSSLITEANYWPVNIKQTYQISVCSKKTCPLQ